MTHDKTRTKPQG